MEIRLIIDVKRREYNRLRPSMTNSDGEPLTKDIDTEALDASGHLEIKGLNGDRICIHFFYEKEE